MSHLNFLLNRGNVEFLKKSKILFTICSQIKERRNNAVEQIKPVYEGMKLVHFSYDNVGKAKVEEESQKWLEQQVKSESNCILLEVADLGQRNMYSDLAKDHGFLPMLICCDDSNGENKVTNVSGPQEGDEKTYPLYWAWFFHDLYSKRYKTLTSLTMQCYDVCLKRFPQFKADMDKHFNECVVFNQQAMLLTGHALFCGNVLRSLFNAVMQYVYSAHSRHYRMVKGKIDFSSVYPSGVPYNDGRELHCTACYGGPDGWKNPDIVAYANKPAVKQALNDVSLLHIVGFVLTPRTAGARVVLTKKQLKVWNNEPVPDTSTSLKSADDGSSTSSLPVGSRSHLTIGCAEGVEAVQTGFDLLQVLELQPKKIRKHDRMELRYYGDGMCSAFYRGSYRIPVKAVFSGR